MEKKEINDTEMPNLLEQIMNLEEYYSIEDYGIFLTIQTCLQTMKALDFFFSSKINLNKNKITIHTVKANFLVDRKMKEVLIEKSILIKGFAIFKIYSENNKFIKILVNRAEKYDINEILKKINENTIFKGAVKIYLNIDEFPIKTYYLEERKIQNAENITEGVEKEFILKKLNKNENNINQVNMNNRVIFINSDENKINLNNINQMNFKHINHNNINQYNNINLNYNINQNNNIKPNNNIYNKNNENFEIIQNNLNNNNCLLNLTKNYIQQNNNNPMNSNLLQMINNLIQINNNIPNNYNNINLMQQNILSLLYNLNQICNNNNQMRMYLQQIFNCLNQINYNIKIIMNLYNNNNNIINKKDNKEKIENKNNIGNNFIFKEYEDYFPLIGLRNVGLCCYMNPILQCLLHIPELNGFFINKYPEQKDKLKQINNDIETRGRLCEEYHKIVREIESVRGQNKTYINPKDFNTFLSKANEQFLQLEENDSKNFLLYLIQVMHAELNYLGDRKLKNVPKCNQLIEKESFNFFMNVSNNLNLSIISYLFYGIHKSITICKCCYCTFYNFQYFQFLSFPTFNFKDKTFNVYQGFKEFIKPEIMSGENQLYCQNCKGLRDAKVTTKIYSSPPYLIINIDYGKNKKYKPEKVIFGSLIDITGFTDSSNNMQNIQYKLIAVYSHIGRKGSSDHYITYCRNNENKWYEFNDSCVSEAKFEEINSNSPFLLIYKKLLRTNN